MKIEIYRTVILPVLYGFESWSFTLTEECRLRVFENCMLRRIFGPKRDKVTGEWRRLHNEELHYLYSSPNIIWVIKSRRIRWAGHVASMGDRRDTYKVLVGRPEGNRPLGRPVCIDGRIMIEWIFRKWDGEVWSGLEQAQVVGTCECGDEPLSSIQCGESLHQLRTAPWGLLVRFCSSH
jgi:hypothetical protein